MKLFIQSLVALAALAPVVPASAAAVSAATAPVPEVSAEAQKKVDFAPNLVAKLNTVAPIDQQFGQVWSQITWARIKTGGELPVDGVSAVDAFQSVTARG